MTTELKQTVRDLLKKANVNTFDAAILVQRMIKRNGGGFLRLGLCEEIVKQAI